MASELPLSNSVFLRTTDLTGHVPEDPSPDGVMGSVVPTRRGTGPVWGPSVGDPFPEETNDEVGAKRGTNFIKLSFPPSILLHVPSSQSHICHGRSGPDRVPLRPPGTRTVGLQSLPEVLFHHRTRHNQSIRPKTTVLFVGVFESLSPNLSDSLRRLERKLCSKKRPTTRHIRRPPIPRRGT